MTNDALLVAFQITSNADIEAFCTGAAFFGTGGGGSYPQARAILSDLLRERSVPALVKLEALQPSEICVSAFGVGATSASSDACVAISNAATALTRVLGTKIAGVVPVEIGPLSVASAYYAASLLKVPVVDADIVGGRASPEVFLETISLFDMKRTPAAIANAFGDTAILLSAKSGESEEKFFRGFASIDSGEAYVVGYPFSAERLFATITRNTVSRCLEAGRLLMSKRSDELLKIYRGRRLFQGRIGKIEKTETAGFLSLMVYIEDQKSRVGKIYVKNEYLVLWVDDCVACSCPELICILDENGGPIPSSELKLNMKVEVLGLPSVEIWHSERGLTLFSPKTFGFDFDAVLLS
jgi:DUF917 family protein